MTQEEKQLLLKDLCARLPYGVKVQVTQVQIGLLKDETLTYNRMYSLDESDEYITIKPYLRPMSSMTEEEKKEYYETMDKYTHRLYPNSADFSKHTEYSWTAETFDWLNRYHFDYRGLIPKGLALEAPEGMYKFKEK